MCVVCCVCILCMCMRMYILCIGVLYVVHVYVYIVYILCIGVLCIVYMLRMCMYIVCIHCVLCMCRWNYNARVKRVPVGNARHCFKIRHFAGELQWEGIWIVSVCVCVWGGVTR